LQYNQACVVHQRFASLLAVIDFGDLNKTFIALNHITNKTCLIHDLLFNMMLLASPKSPIDKVGLIIVDSQHSLVMHEHLRWEALHYPVMHKGFKGGDSS